MRRRNFLMQCAVAGAAFAGPALGDAVRTTQAAGDGFFTLGQRRKRWFFIRPDGRPFFSLGLNHIDSASLRYRENIHLWRDKYGGSQRRWLQESVAPNLKSWGFNTVGWTQEVVTRGFTNHRHSRAFTREEYQWLDLPYCHLLPFAETHQWEAETKNPDFQSTEWEDWCDHVAREHCAVLADDPRLIGYFYVDCPTWVHVRPINKWKGPLFDPDKLASAAGRQELFALASRYYKVTHDAIRRYDKHHLILGDRYEANAPLPIEVVNAAKPFVDVLSFQDFRQPAEHLAEWYQNTGMPVLWADGARSVAVEDPTYPGGQYRRNSGQWYADVLAALRQNPGCIGAHLCGAYLRNRVRRYGLLDEQDRPDAENVRLMTAAHQATEEWLRGYGG